MTVIAHQDVCSHFFDQVRHAARRVLLLDYDGTLAPFTPDRMRAFPYREIPELISKVMHSGTRVVLVSGRPATELVFLSGIHPHPEIWGSHGLERLHPDATYEMEPLPERHSRALAMAEKALRAVGLGTRLESKPGGIAIHWRGLSPEEASSVEHKTREVCTKFLKGSGLSLLQFDGGLELRAPAKNKGDAVSAILAEEGRSAAVAYLGDDETDENAFRAIKGRGLAVLVRPEPRPTMADAWLRPPDDLGQFLRDWLLACGAEA